MSTVYHDGEIYEQPITPPSAEVRVSQAFKDFLEEKSAVCSLTDAQRESIRNLTGALKQQYIDQALFNLSYLRDIKPGQETIKDWQVGWFKQELNDIFVVAGQLDLPSVTGLTVDFENPADADQKEDVEEDATKVEEKKNKIHARNLLRHLIYGTPLTDSPDKNYKESHLYQPEIMNALFHEKNPDLLQAMRDEVTGIFKKLLTPDIFDKLNNDPFFSAQYALFQKTFLSIYPFLEPENQEKIRIPQKIVEEWAMVEYQFKKIDVSPQSGPLAWLLEEQDRIYAYGLEPVGQLDSTGKLQNLSPYAPSHLLFMGTTYPAGQGSRLANLYNFLPFHSVGEGHAKVHVNQFLEEQYNNNREVELYGDSKGGTMVIALAIQNPYNNIVEATSLNPTGLSLDTQRRLKAEREKAEQDEKNPEGSGASSRPTRPCPNINVYTQYDDPVFYWEGGFMEDMNIYRIFSARDESKLALNSSFFPYPVPGFLKRAWETHAHHFLPRPDGVLVLRTSLRRENAQTIRLFSNDIKAVFNLLIFPVSYSAYCLELIERKLVRFYEENQKTIRGLLIGLAILAIGAAFIFCPVVGQTISFYLMLLLNPVAMKFGFFGAIFLGSLLLYGGGALVAFATPFVLEFAAKATSWALTAVGWFYAVVAGVVAGLVGSLSALLRMMVRPAPEKLMHNIEQSKFNENEIKLQEIKIEKVMPVYDNKREGNQRGDEKNIETQSVKKQLLTN